jgi:iron complex transport system substrate-binding protein
LIADAGSLAVTFASLADRVQEQTGIPYLLFDGSFAQTAQTLRTLGGVLGETARGNALADYVDNTLAEIGKRVATVPAEKRPRVYYARTPSGLQTALSGSIIGSARCARRSHGRHARPGPAAWRGCLWSRCWLGIPR